MTASHIFTLPLLILLAAPATSAGDQRITSAQFDRHHDPVAANLNLIAIIICAPFDGEMLRLMPESPYIPAAQRVAVPLPIPYGYACKLQPFGHRFALTYILVNRPIAEWSRVRIGGLVRSARSSESCRRRFQLHELLSASRKPER